MSRIIGYCLGCKCLPEKLFGTDVDALFAYRTPKVVVLQDRSLGLLKHTLMLLIFIYIFIYNIWYQGQHYQLHEIEGFARQTWKEPTREWCNPQNLECQSNFTRVTDLDYCSQYVGASPGKVTRPCNYYDARELPITLTSGILIPTYVQSFPQARQCHDGDTMCARKYAFTSAGGAQQMGSGYAQPEQRNFVANAEDFTLTIDHSFRTTDGKVAYDDFLMQGRWSICDRDLHRDSTDYYTKAAKIMPPRSCKTRPIECVHERCDEMAHADENKDWIKKIPKLEVNSFDERPRPTAATSARLRSAAGAARRGESSLLSVGAEPLELQGIHEYSVGEAPTSEELAAAKATSEAPNVVSMKGGDTLTLRTLLAMAGESLDEAWYDPDDGTQSVRSRGTALLVTIHYANDEPWTLLNPRNPPWYTISVSARPAHEFMHAHVENLGSGNRELKWSYGVYVIIKQTGAIRTFSVSHALVALTSALTLLAVSSLVTDMLAMYVMPKKAQYKQFMNEISHDMGDDDGQEDEKSNAEEDTKSKAEEDAGVPPAQQKLEDVSRRG